MPEHAGAGKGGKRSDLGGLYVRSSWEANYARYLNFLQREGSIEHWEYEPDTFEFIGIKRGTRFYTPDFKVFNNDARVEYHEVKGYVSPKHKTQMRRMARYFPNIKVVVIGKEEYWAIAQWRNLIDNWEKVSKSGNSYIPHSLPHALL